MRAYEGNDPIVNNVCFCLPLPFFFPAGCESTDTSLSLGASAGVDVPLPFALPPFPAPQATVGVGDSPRILRKDWLPLIASLGTRVTDVVGNSGKALFDKTTGVALLFAPGPGIEVGPLITGGLEAAAIEAEAHGVLC